MVEKRTSLLDSITAEDRKKLDESLKPLDGVSLGDLFESARHETEKYNQDLRTRAKTPEQLTEGLECVVEEVNDYQGSTSVTDEPRMGGPSTSQKTGHVYRTEIRVLTGTFVKKLKFKGWPHLEAGDTIKAYILKGQKESEKSFEVDLYHNPPSHWVERDYQPIEQPSKIEKLRDGKVVATYHNS